VRLRATAPISQFGDAGLAQFWLPRLQFRRIWARAQQAINPRRGASAHGRSRGLGRVGTWLLCRRRLSANALLSVARSWCSVTSDGMICGDWRPRLRTTTRDPRNPAVF